MIESLRRYWWVVLFLGTLVVYASKLEAVLQTPEKLEKAKHEFYEQVKETDEAVEDLSDTVSEFIAAQEVVNTNNKTLINLLAQLAGGPTDGQ